MATKIEGKVRDFMIESMALGDSYSTIASAVQDQFGVQVSRQLVRSYDPTLHGRDSKVWTDRRTFYNAARDNFLSTVAAVPTSHRAIRLRRLDRMASSAEEMRNYQLAAQILEQIAKEVGDVYTNTKHLAHSGGLRIEDFLYEADEIEAADRQAGARDGSRGVTH